MDFYVPIAYYLGSYRFKNELEDLCFRYIDKDKYLITKKDLEQYIEETKDEVINLVYSVKDLLAENKIDFRITYRTKNIYGEIGRAHV